MKTVLVIEDHPDIRDNVTEMLELEGYFVISARNGKDGISLAKEKNPNIILCDIWMPEINGYEVFDSLKKDTATAQIPFIFLTASAEKHEVEQGLGMGADAYLKKPFEPEELFSILAHHLDGK